MPRKIRDAKIQNSRRLRQEKLETEIKKIRLEVQELTGVDYGLDKKEDEEP